MRERRKRLKRVCGVVAHGGVCVCVCRLLPVYYLHKSEVVVKVCSYVMKRFPVDSPQIAMLVGTCVYASKVQFILLAIHTSTHPSRT